MSISLADRPINGSGSRRVVRAPRAIAAAFCGGDNMANRTCSIEGCEKRPNGRGWCGMHYSRWQKYGDPLHISRGCSGLTLEQHLLLRMDNSGGPDACWPWTGPVGPTGYGKLDLSSWCGTRQAHRAVYLTFVGELVDELQIDHGCHDPEVCEPGIDCPHRRCVNPAHLRPSSARENVLRGGGPSAINARATHCIHGHDLGPNGNVRREKNGKRRCRICERDRMRRFRAGQRVAA